VCIPPQWVGFVKRKLQNSNVKVATVVGFPHGNTLTEVKVSEAQAAIDLGADEIDMVIQIGKLKESDAAAVKADIEAVVRAAKARKEEVETKVILETSALEQAHKVLGCRLVAEAGAGFVKTTTGFHPTGGATLSDVALLRKNVPDRMGVKAAGGIRDLKTALAMIGAGATRLGCSSSVAILDEFRGEKASTAPAADIPPLKPLQHEYAWDYFQFHAQQRTSMFNYFIILMAGLAATYGYLVARSPAPFWDHALWVAIAGIVVTPAFIGLDCRNRNLVHRAERILKKLEQEEIFHEEQIDPAFKGLLLRDEDTDRLNWTERPLLRWIVKHSKLIPLVLVVILIAFIIAAVSAFQSKTQTISGGSQTQTSKGQGITPSGTSSTIQPQGTVQKPNP